MLAPSIYALIVAALAALASPALSAAAESPCPSVLDHQFSNLRDEPVSLCQFRGKVLILERWTDRGALDTHARLAPPPFRPELRTGNTEREDYAYNRTR